MFGDSIFTLQGVYKSRGVSLSDDTKDALKTIEYSGKNLLKMINEILDISKIEEGKMVLNETIFDLNELFKQLSTMFEFRCQQKHLKWNAKKLTGQILVRGDEAKLRQILINILDNSVKFTESGEVSFSITPLAGQQYQFDIIDTGNGIPTEAHKNIFSPFQQEEEGSKKGGTGLGLTITKKILELMKSDLSLKSELNAGAHFYFTVTLPSVDLAEKKLNIEPKNTSKVLYLAKNCKVKSLIVDDVKENRDVLAKLLSSIGVEIFIAENGLEGIEKIKTCQPDIIFMDMRMPVMNGKDATQKIQEEFGKEKIKIVSITASAINLKKQDYLDMGFHAYISKPFMEDQIFDCLKELLPIKFIYEEENCEPKNSKNTEDFDASNLSLPEELLNNIKEAAELYKVTDLESCLDEMAVMGGETKKLQDQLQALLKNYDMDGIIETLKSVNFSKEK